jgi:hypothetical protein
MQLFIFNSQWQISETSNIYVWKKENSLSTRMNGKIRNEIKSLLIGQISSIEPIFNIRYNTNAANTIT